MKTKQKLEQVARGKFIVFEGIDGSGKSTQIQLLKERLREEGIYCYTTMEPTDSPIGSLIHQAMTGRIKIDNKVIATLFAADRLDHLLNDVNGILAKVEAGVTVLADRYYFSSYAYHSIDLPIDWVIKINEPCKSILAPTVTVYIDSDPDIAIKRIAQNRAHQELFENKTRLIRVKQQYEEVFDKLKDEEVFVSVNGNKSPEMVAEEIWNNIKCFLRDEVE